MRGYVFYLDLIGVSHLSTYPEFSGVLEEKIKLFHDIIKKHVSKCKHLKYNSISDSVFLNTDEEKYIKKDNKMVITMNCFFIIANIFRDLLEQGILCRAGCSYGEYKVLPTKLFDKNILGKAISESVSLEKNGKGHRIFISKDVYEQFSDIYKLLVPDGARKMQEIKNLISRHTNYSDYTELFEFNWIYINNNIFFESNTFYKLSNHNIEQLKKDNSIVNSNLIILNAVMDNDKLKSYKEYPVDEKNNICKNNEIGEKVINIMEKYIQKNHSNIKTINSNLDDKPKPTQTIYNIYNIKL